MMIMIQVQVDNTSILTQIHTHSFHMVMRAHCHKGQGLNVVFSTQLIEQADKTLILRLENR